MINTIFFDLYGTLAGFSPDRFEIQSKACNKFGYKVTRNGITQGYAIADNLMSEQNQIHPIRNMNIQERENFFSEYQKLILSGDKIKINTETASKIWNYIKKIPYDLACYNDVHSSLKTLKSKGLKLGLISNMNTDGNQLSSKLGLSNYLDFVITSKDVKAEKPHPKIFIKALEKANEKAENCIHIGDQIISDIRGAKNAGITPVLIDRDNINNNFKECKKITSLTELSDIIISFKFGNLD